MADDPVMWPELLTEYGLEKLRVQNLAGSLVGQQTTRADHTTKLSFRTEIPLGDVVNDRVAGFVLWFNRDELDAALNRCKERRMLVSREDNANG